MSKSNEPEKRRFQFRLRGLIWATFWASITLAAWRMDYEPANHDLFLMVAIVALQFLSPFVALGALAGAGDRRPGDRGLRRILRLRR